MAYLCNEIKAVRVTTPENTVITLHTCTSYTHVGSGYKLTNEQMGSYIFVIALMFATAAIFRVIKRSFF